MSPHKPLPPKEAVRRGHKLKSDPPFFSSALRWTCETCGAAAIRVGSNEYGTATTKDCAVREGV